ncbi:MAG: hypothetical protein NTV12_07595, partial [Verrucomicrobia bacterium]|nr:hypothetical protein [Verrucomicrobiota bacterium]
MPQQLIYTSAPRGLVPGRSGHCTVARSESMGESLMLRLEQLSYYTHLSLAGGTNRPIYSYREVRIRSDSFYVLSRIDDSGLDFTGRTNFIAHHLVFTSDEILKYKCPAIILRDWEGFKNSWGPERHPELLKNENENWDSIKFSKETKPSGKATTWEEKTGDAINGYGILEASRSGLAFQVDGVLEDTILAMFAESVALLEVRDGGRNFQATAWRYFFTTSLQEQDNQADFRWCCFHQDNPAKSRFAEGAYKSLLKVVPPSDLTEDQKDFAKNGGSAPTFVEQPASDSQRTVGDELILILKAKATGCPTPEYQWMEVDLMTKEVVPLPNKTGVDLVVDTKTFGLRLYQLRASNSSGECLSEVAKVEVNNRKEAIATPPQWNRSPEATPNNPLILKTSDKTDRRKKEWTDSYRAPVEPGSRFGKTLAWICVIVVVGLFLYFGFNYLAGRDSYKITSKTPPSGWSLYRIGSVKTNDQSFTLETNSPNFAQKLFKTRTPNTAFTLTAVVPKFEEKQESFLFAGTTNLTIATQPDNTPTYCETTLIDLPDDSMSRGIMIRSFADAINSNARFLFVGVSGGSIVVSQRDEVRGKTKDNNVGNFKGIQTLSLRFIEREGDTCDAQYKLKGRDWTLITNTFKLSGSPLIGVAIASRNESNAGTFTGRFAFNGNLTTST